MVLYQRRGVLGFFWMLHVSIGWRRNCHLAHASGPGLISPVSKRGGEIRCWRCLLWSVVVLSQCAHKVWISQSSCERSLRTNSLPTSSLCAFCRDIFHSLVPSLVYCCCCSQLSRWSWEVRNQTLTWSAIQAWTVGLRVPSHQLLALLFIQKFLPRDLNRLEIQR